MMKKIITLLLVIVLMFTSNNQLKAEIICNNEEEVLKISEIDGVKWAIPDFMQDCLGMRHVNLEDFVSQIGGEPYWRDGSIQEYVIYKIEDNGPHYLILDTWDRWYVSKIPSKSLFQKYVDVGVSLDVVKLIDPDTYNLYDGTVYKKDVYLSYHRFADGMIAKIRYKKNSKGQWVVGALWYVEDRTPIVKNLIDKDYQLIKNDNPNEEAEFLEKLKKLQGNSTQENNLKKPAKLKIKSAKRTKKKTIAVKFNKAKNAKKYQIQYATNKKFKNAKIKTTKKLNYKIKKLLKNKTYYIRVRGINGTKNGAWSKIKKVKRVK